MVKQSTPGKGGGVVAGTKEALSVQHAWKCKSQLLAVPGMVEGEIPQCGPQGDSTLGNEVSTPGCARHG